MLRDLACLVVFMNHDTLYEEVKFGSLSVQHSNQELMGGSHSCMYRHYQLDKIIFTIYHLIKKVQRTLDYLDTLDQGQGACWITEKISFYSTESMYPDRKKTHIVSQGPIAKFRSCSMY